MVTTAAQHAGFLTALLADSRSPDIPEHADIYGWLVGDRGGWELDVLRYWGMDVASQRIKGAVHASWVLRGRAVQDIWTMPRLPAPADMRHLKLEMHGTTLRTWDPTIDAWRITWRNPAGDHHEDQIGRRVGADIVQLGTRPDGTPTRWMFTEITPDSFHWLGHALEPDGQTWRLEGEFRARRTKP
jgi:hypothetical protein